MTLDHLTRYVLPEAWNLDWAGSSLGRIAFPLFAAMVAWHGLFSTRNPLRYARYRSGALESRWLALGGLAAGAHRLAPAVPRAMPRRLWLAWYPGHFALIALWLWLAGGLG